jgi:hypothetical protein
MKACPKCGQVFNDDNLSFCLLDGERLVAGVSEPTLVIPPNSTVSATPQSPGKRRRTFLWVAVALLILVVGGVILTTVAFISYRIGNERGRSNIVVATNSTPTPVSKTSATPLTTSTPSPQTTSSSPESADDEVTPIAWNTSAGQLKPDVGLTYKFECPKDGTAIAIWGSDIYTADSSICTAAVHAGKITLEEGGQVTIEMRPGRSIYGSTTRNGVTSNTYGEYPHSFVVR